MSFELRFDPEPDVVGAARVCEQAVFLQTYGNTPDEWEEEYGPYEATSKFLTVSEPGGDVVAACRFILPSDVGLKTLVDVSRAPWSIDGVRAAHAAGMDLARTWDVATIAVRKGAGPPALLSTALYYGLWQAIQANDARWIVMIMDSRARRLLDLLYLKTNVLPSARPGPYLGSAASVPLWSDMPAMIDLQRRMAPESYRLVTQGGGLGDVRVPDTAGFRVRPPARVAPAALEETRRFTG